MNENKHIGIQRYRELVYDVVVEFRHFKNLIRKYGLPDFEKTYKEVLTAVTEYDRWEDDSIITKYRRWTSIKLNHYYSKLIRATGRKAKMDKKHEKYIKIVSMIKEGNRLNDVLMYFEEIGEPTTRYHVKQSVEWYNAFYPEMKISKSQYLDVEKTRTKFETNESIDAKIKKLEERKRKMEEKI